MILKFINLGDFYKECDLIKLNLNYLSLLSDEIIYHNKQKFKLISLDKIFFINMNF